MIAAMLIFKGLNNPHLGMSKVNSFAWIMIEDKVPEYLKFLVVDMCVEELPFKGNYISIEDRKSVV